MNGDKPSPKDGGAPPDWLRLGCIALVLVLSAVLAIYMFGR